MGNIRWRNCLIAVPLACILFIPMFAMAVVVVLSIYSIIMALLLPPSLILYYMSHLAQISRNCRANSKKIAEFRGGLAHFIGVCFLFVALTSSIWLLIFRYSPGLKHRNIHDLPIWKWVAVLEVICLFGICTMAVGMNRYLDLRFPNLTVDLARFFEGLTGLVGCGLILLAVLSVIRVAPVLKQPTILGLQAREWLLVILLVLLAHNAIRILTSLAAAWLRIHYEQNIDPSGGSPSQEGQPVVLYQYGLEGLVRMILSYLLPSEDTLEWRRLHVVYFAQGLSRSINFLLTSLLFLLTWILYFGTRLNRTSATIREAYDYVTWTLVCVFIISISWLVKDAIVLSWASRVVYDRFHDEISQRSTELWLLGILGGRKFDILDIDWKNRHKDLDQVRTAIKEKLQRDQSGQEGEDQRDNKGTSQEGEDQRDNKGTSQEGDGKDYCEIDMIDDKSEDQHSNKDGNNGRGPKTPISLVQYSRSMLPQRPDKEARHVLVPSAGQKDRLPIHNIEGMAAYFLAAEGPLSKKSYVSGFCKKWYRINGRSNIHENKPPIMDLDKKEIEEEDVIELRSKIQNNTFDNWIEKAHKSSLDIARSLSGAKEVVDSLNQIIAWLIIAVAIVIWLLLTGIATTKILVLIASPVLAVSFIFGDTCKTFFQGFMFAYVLHPFTVGDRCTINGITEVMEVMRIGVWKTIFSKVGSEGHEVIYPNSVLASSPIVKIYPNSVLASSPIVKLTGIDPDDED